MTRFPSGTCNDLRQKNSSFGLFDTNGELDVCMSQVFEVSNHSWGDEELRVVLFDSCA